MIGVVDYGMGNLYSVSKALERLGAKAELVETADGVRKADKLILPGVGAFGDAMKELQKRDLIAPILDAVAQKKPLLGVCLGLQLLFESSEEGGEHEGLGLVRGRVRKFSSSELKGEKRIKIPHMGWNQVAVLNGGAVLFHEVPPNEYFYFVHSYYVVPDETAVIAGQTDYGIKFTSAISSGRVYGCQFHPEKSHRFGQVVLKNFLERA